jgi:hypothetical protein
MSSNERHNRRDEIISLKHRTWGYNVPAVDIDFLLCEYDNRKAVALIEYRHYNGNLMTDSANMLALIDLADRAGLPAFCVQYKYETDDGTLWKEATVDTPAEFRIIPLNPIAEGVYGNWDTKGFLPEPVFVAWLHHIRGRRV